MLLKKLKKLANKLDEYGYTKEASEVDQLLKKIVAFFETPNCTCRCEECEYAKNLIGRPASKDHHKNCVTGQCEIKKSLEK